MPVFAGKQRRSRIHRIIKTGNNSLIRIFAVISFFLGGLAFDELYAQPDSPGRALTHDRYKMPVQKETPSQKDLIDCWRALTGSKNPRVDTIDRSVGRLHFSMVPAIGYTLSTGWAGILAANVGFYTSNPDKTNLSSITTSMVYSQYNQLTVPILANLWTRNNKYNFVTDWRYYKYPQDTYGLGEHSALRNAELIDYSHLRIHQSVLRKIVPAFYAGIGYFLDYHWNVNRSRKGDSVLSDAENYGLPSHSLSSGPGITLLYDNRKNSINPSGGLYANVLYRDNLKIFGSDDNWQSLTIDIRKYFPFPSGSHNILAFWSYDWLTISGKPPYLDLPSTGWDAYNNTGRGYIQGRFRGKNMLYLESEYRFRITRNGLLGGVFFVNGQSFSNYPSNSADYDVIWPGFGAGIRVKVNKHSNTNIAVDYGFGADGSHGLFVNLGEVF